MRLEERANEDDTLRDLERLAWLLDDVVRIPGTRVRLGLDSVIGLLPAGGDLVAGALSSWIIVAAARLGAPAAVIARMGLNVLVDTIVGAVPVLGDLFDVAFKANRRNIDLLSDYIESPGHVRRSSMAVLVAVLLVLAAALVGAAFVTVLLVRTLIGLF